MIQNQEIDTKPTVQERLADGELVHVTNLLQPDYDSLVPDIYTARLRQEELQRLKQLYGPDQIVTGPAFDETAQTVKPDPHRLGVYVTEAALRLTEPS